MTRDDENIKVDKERLKIFDSTARKRYTFCFPENVCKTLIEGFKRFFRTSIIKGNTLQLKTSFKMFQEVEKQYEIWLSQLTDKSDISALSEIIRNDPISSLFCCNNILLCTKLSLYILSISVDLSV